MLVSRVVIAALRARRYGLFLGRFGDFVFGTILPLKEEG